VTSIVLLLALSAAPGAPVGSPEALVVNPEAPAVSPGASPVVDPLSAPEGACRREHGIVTCFGDDFDRLTRMTLDYRLRAESCELRLKDCSATLENWKGSLTSAKNFETELRAKLGPYLGGLGAADRLRRALGVTLAVLGAVATTAVLSVDMPIFTRTVVGVSGALTCAAGFTVALF